MKKDIVVITPKFGDRDIETSSGSRIFVNGTELKVVENIRWAVDLRHSDGVILTELTIALAGSRIQHIELDEPSTHEPFDFDFVADVRKAIRDEIVKQCQEDRHGAPYLADADDYRLNIDGSIGLDAIAYAVIEKLRTR